MKTKKTLESISKAIREKRNETLDTQDFPFSELTLSKYDIRENRDASKLRDNLVRDGQLQAITITEMNGIWVIINGRTRYLAMKEINADEETKDLFATVNVEVYEDLTLLEQDYLNAQINAFQKTLSGNEKVNFVRKYVDVLDAKALAEALDVADKMVELYIEVSDMSDKVLKAFSPKSDGHGRSDTKLEELAKVSIAYKKESGGVAPTEETLIAIGEESERSNSKRDNKRKLMPKIAKKVAKLQNNPLVINKHTPKEIVKIASKETTLTDATTSGDVLPKNSSEKYKIVDGLLKVNYEFAVLLFAEKIYRTDDKGVKWDSETKRIIDNVDEIIVVGNEVDKLYEIEEYALSLGKKVTIHNEHVINALDVLKDDDRRGIIYVNGAGLYSQRPEFMNYLKKKYSESVVAMVTLDLLFCKSQVQASDIRMERLTVYAGAENFDEVLAVYKKTVKFLKVRQYATSPQKKYIIYV